MSLPIFSFYIDKKKLVSYAVLAFVLGSLLGGSMWNFAGVYIPKRPPSDLLLSSSLNKFSSLEELTTFIGTRPQEYYLEDTGKSIGGQFWRAPPPSPTMTFDQISASSATEAYDYSGTNIQVEGVDEADIVKTDGKFIYLASEKIVYIIRAYPTDEAGIVTKIEPERYVSDLYINGDKLVLISAPDYFYHWYGWDIAPDEEFEFTTKIWVYDLSELRETVTLERTVSVDGYYTNSRMIKNYVYLITSQPAILNYSEPILPAIKYGNETCYIEATDVWYVNNTDINYGYTNIIALNVQDPQEDINIETYLLGSSSTIYASMEHIYLTNLDWVTNVEGGWETTTIYKLKVDDGSIQYIAEGTVPGRVLNQFSMDEKGEYFRIATTSGFVSRNGGGTSNNLYILNASLGIIGTLEDLAPGEDIYSARFMGERCYLVTFKKVDPLFVIDLKNPMKPMVLGKLKIPGYSDYLHPYDDNTLIGIGKETVEAEEGNFAWYQGVKISLFDVSDVSNPKELAKYEIGDRGTDSPALHNHKAFLFSQSKNLLVIPVLETKIDSSNYGGEVPANAYGDFVYQGAYVMHISPEDGILLRGKITHIEDPQTFLKSGYWFESELSVERSLYIEEVLYTISGRMIKMNDLQELSEVGKVDLN